MSQKGIDLQDMEKFIEWLEQELEYPSMHRKYDRRNGYHSDMIKTKYQLEAIDTHWQTPREMRYYLASNDEMDYRISAEVGELLLTQWAKKGEYSWSKDKTVPTGYVMAKTILKRLQTAKNERMYLEQEIADRYSVREHEEHLAREGHLRNRMKGIDDAACKFVREFLDDNSRFTEKALNEEDMTRQYNRKVSHGVASYVIQELPGLVETVIQEWFEQQESGEPEGCGHCRGIGDCNWSGCDNNPKEHAERESEYNKVSNV